MDLLFVLCGGFFDAPCRDESAAEDFALLRGDAPEGPLLRRAELESSHFDVSGCTSLVEACSEDYRNEDFVSLMQVGPPTEDLVSLYIRETMQAGTPVVVRSWYHPWDQLGRLQSNIRDVHFDFQLPGAAVVRSPWGRILGRRSCVVTPVRSPPYDFGLIMPHFLVIAPGDPRYVPALVEYQDAQQTRRGSFIFQTTVFPPLSWFFQRIEPFNQCVWAAECTIAVGNHAAARLYTWGEHVPLYEGIFLVLRERQLLRAGGEDDDDDDDDGGGSSFGTSTSCGTGENDDASDFSGISCGSCEDPEMEQEDVSGLMHLFTQAEIAITEVVHELHFPQSQSHFGIVHAGQFDSAGPDVVRLFASDRLGLPRNLVTTVYVWGVARPHFPVAYFARRCAWVPDKSFTKVLIGELEDVAGFDVWGFTIPFPVIEPLSLRAYSIDLIGMPTSQLDIGEKAFILDVIGLPLPKRVAVHVEREGTLHSIIQKLGITSTCQTRGTLCYLEVSNDGEVRYWLTDQVVDELHGTSMLLRISAVQACRNGELDRGLGPLPGDEMTLFQPAIHQRSMRLPITSEVNDDGDQFEMVIQQNLRWHELRRRVARLTRFLQFDHLRDEALAFRAARGRWPDIVLCGVIADEISFWNLETDGLLELASFDKEEVQTLLRDFVEPPVSQEARVILAAVKPLPTVHEQNGHDDLYVIVGEDLRTDEVLALVAV